MTEYTPFSVSQEIEIAASPEDLWDAITMHPEGWLWPMDPIEPRLGGGGPFGSVVTAWDPPRHYVNRSEGPDGFYNELDQTIEDRGDGTVLLRYVHNGVIETKDWDAQYDGVREHTAFYLDALSRYVVHFGGRTAVYAAADGPASSQAPDAVARVRAALGVPDDASVGDRVAVSLPGAGSVESEVDFLNEHFVGLRTQDAMYRFFGRAAFGAPLSVGHHLYAPGLDAKAESAVWQEWLDRLFA